ncbi:hypothetical protein DDZ18_12530 [Marinicauda salina]|uniref:RapA2 cadherin-like domain-containing protein n=1 Tax=Marinicauda salina TaxID=2135793 RepID=A0A2U2BRE6_9PROT|nr:VCBS domain-containing protein [Marinicauda salina]PWE16587.1 hypothetical protein DDZ18_12530 [Marinicauda salina]
MPKPQETPGRPDVQGPPAQAAGGPPPGRGPAGARIAGSGENDVFVSTAADETFVGGGGVDTVIFDGDARDYAFATSGRGASVSGEDGNDVLIKIEAAQFDNATVYLDGRNNAPVVDDHAVDLVEDGEAVTVDALADAWDFENDAVSLVSVDGSAFDGEVSFDPATGEITFDPGDAYQGLGEGETVDVEVGFTASDGQDVTDGVVTVTITGTADTSEQTLSGWQTIGESAIADGTIEVIAETDDRQTDSEIEAFLGMTTTLDAFSLGDAASGSAIMTTVTLDAAGTLSFTFDLAGGDEGSSVFRDFGFITINGEPIMLEQYPGVEGPQSFSIELEAGTYEIGFGAVDMDDPFFGPTLTITDLVVETSGSTASSLTTASVSEPETVTTSETDGDLFATMVESQTEGSLDSFFPGSATGAAHAGPVAHDAVNAAPGLDGLEADMMAAASAGV